MPGYGDCVIRHTGPMPFVCGECGGNVASAVEVDGRLLCDECDRLAVEAQETIERVRGECGARD